jgi:hypothetical protein
MNHALDRAFNANPDRFVKKPPTPPAKPTAVWINPPLPTESQADKPKLARRVSQCH